MTLLLCPWPIDMPFSQNILVCLKCSAVFQVGGSILDLVSDPTLLPDIFWSRFSFYFWIWNSSPDVLPKPLKEDYSDTADDDPFRVSNHLALGAGEDLFEEWTEFSDSNLSLPQFSFHEPSEDEVGTTSAHLQQANLTANSPRNSTEAFYSPNVETKMINVLTEEATISPSIVKKNNDQITSLEADDDLEEQHCPLETSYPVLSHVSEEIFAENSTISAMQSGKEDAPVDANNDDGCSMADQQHINVSASGHKETVIDKAFPSTQVAKCHPLDELPELAEDLPVGTYNCNLENRSFLEKSELQFAPDVDSHTGQITEGSLHGSHHGDHIGNLERGFEKLELQVDDSSSWETHSTDTSEYEDTYPSNASSNFPHSDGDGSSSYDEIQ